MSATACRVALSVLSTSRLSCPCRVAALADRLRRLASCKAGQAACLFMRGVRVHISMAAQCWPKFFCHSMASSSICFMLFHMYVSFRCCMCSICCNGYVPMLQVYVSNILVVSSVCYKCFIWMLHMLQWLYTYVANVCFKCNCFKRMLQVFYLDVAYVALAIHICGKCIFQMF
jgi:hypothetical protein